MFNLKLDIYFILCFILISTCLGFTYTSIGGNVFTQGDKYWMECSLDSNSSYLEFVKKGIYFYPWGKQHQRMSIDHNWGVARNGVLSPEFQITGRYNLTLLNETTQHYRLEIKDLQPEDSGTIGCREVTSGQNVTQEVVTNVTVIGIPKLTWQDISSGNVIDIHELTVIVGQPVHIRCLVNFHTIQPNMRIRVFREKHGMRPWLWEDVSSAFEVHPGEVISWELVDGELDSEFTTEYRTLGDPDALGLNYSHDGAALTCQAPANAAGINIRKDLPITLLYEPYIECAESWMNSNGTVTLRCFVFSNPEPKVTWYHIVTNQSMEDGVSTSKEFDIHVYLSILTIHKKDKDVYSLQTSNSLGTTYASKTFVPIQDTVNAAVPQLLDFVLGSVCLIMQILLQKQ